MTATIHQFPAPVDRYASEILDALEPLRAICCEAAQRLTPNQRFDLEARLIDSAVLACAALTDGLRRTDE